MDFYVFSMFSKEFEGFGKAKKWVLNLFKNDFHEWKKRNHENRGVLWRKKGSKMKVSFEVEGGKNGVCSSTLAWKSVGFLNVK